MRAAFVVGLQIRVECDLHLIDGHEPGAPAFGAEVLVEQGAAQALDDAVGLAASPGCGGAWAGVAATLGQSRFSTHHAPPSKTAQSPRAKAGFSGRCSPHIVDEPDKRVGSECQGILLRQ